MHRCVFQIYNIRVASWHMKSKNEFNVKNQHKNDIWEYNLIYQIMSVMFDLFIHFQEGTIQVLKPKEEETKWFGRPCRHLYF